MPPGRSTILAPVALTPIPSASDTVTLAIVVVGEAGLEPTTPGLEGRCSIQLSYSPVPTLYRQPAPHRSNPVSLHDHRQGESERLAQASPAPCAVAPQPSTNQVTPNPVRALDLRVPQDKFHPSRPRRNGAQRSRVTTRIHRSWRSKLDRSAESRGSRSM